MDQQKQKAALNQRKQAERNELLAGMPLLPEKLHQLLEYLDANLKLCDHTSKLTEAFLDHEQLEKNNVLPWLRERGGYCDCEVLANLADLDDSLQSQPPVPRNVVRQKQNQTPRSLDTVTGWNLAKLPTPWRVANMYSCNEPIRLELGKKGGCTLLIVESPFQSGDQSSDEFWTRLWYDRTELSAKDTVQITHNVLNILPDFTSTLVRSPSWIPVYCWVIPSANSWHLEIKTELNRCAGDLPQISSLISFFTKGQA